MNFFDDHTKMILSKVRTDFTVTYIDQDRCARTYSLGGVARDGCTGEVMERLTFARSMLRNLVDIEGADI